MPASAQSQPSGDFLSVARALALLSPEQIAQLSAEAESRHSHPSLLALQKGLLSVTQVDIVETLLRPTDVIPGYEILGVLGQGGMGVVYRARQLTLKRIVALKTVLASEMGDEAALQRFEQEAQAVAQLAHPHIIAAYDFGRHDGRLYFAMELVEGEDLQQFIARHGRLDERTTWCLVRQAAAGLAHAATQKIVHRDIKPANLLLVAPPAGFPLPAGVPLVKIADFGLARLAAAAEDATRLTTVGTTVGSPYYMCPEQLRGDPVDQRADMFALGATAFQMLAGQPPLCGKTLSQIMAHRMSGLAEPVQAVRPQVSRHAAELVAAMMAHDPDKRLSDYGDLAERIDALAEHGAVVDLSVRSDVGGATVPYLLSTEVPPTKPFSAEPTRPIRATSSPRLRQVSLAITGLAVLLALLGTIIPATLGRRNTAGERNMVIAGSAGELFNGRDIDGWRIVSGGWGPAKNSEGAVVLQGKGDIRRTLVDHDAAGEARPLEHYRLMFLVDLHDASSVELQFDFGDGGSADTYRVLRIDDKRSELGERSSGQTTPRWTASLIHAKGGSSELHAVGLERQSQGWWVFVDERFLGSVPFDGAWAGADIGLATEGGPAWFSDFTVDVLVPGEEK